MIHDLNFDSSGAERMSLCQDAEKPFNYNTMTYEQKVIFIQGMNAGFYQGVRDQTKKIITNFTLLICGFQP